LQLNTLQNLRMQFKGGPRLLVTDREGAIYLERARIKVEDGRIVYYIVDDEQRRKYNVPHVNLAVLFMGQGTSITQEAMRLLGDERVHVAVTGTGGTPLHMGSLTTYTATEHFRKMLPVYQEPSLSLVAAKAVMVDRAGRMRSIGIKQTKKYLRSRDVSGIEAACGTLVSDLDRVGDIQQLLGIEGAFSKRCYREFAVLSGLSKTVEFRRQTGEASKKKPKEPLELVNHLIDHGNYLAYGMAGAALWALGIPPQMSVFHGKTRAGGLVFDLADSFKDAFVLPLAFASVIPSRETKPEKIFRARMISAFDDHRVLKEAIDTVNRMVTPEVHTKASENA